MNTVLCAMAKHENIYINEWCKHYLDLGFSHIYIYDNNEIDYPNIKDYIDKKILKKVTIFDYRGQTFNHTSSKLVEVYQMFYDKYKDTFDWCAFFDIDEFLDGIDNINSFLSQIKFNNVKQIKVAWKLFGDNDIIKRDLTQPVHEFFKSSKPITEIKNNVTKCTSWFNACKFFIAGHQNDIKIVDVHFATKLNGASLNTKYISGNNCSYPNSHYALKPELEKETIFLNHYITKTLDEFIEYKYLKTNTLSLKEVKTDLDYFWAFNDKTPEKENYLKSKGLIC